FPNVGENLRLLRQEMGISLDKASKMTGVSKAMLGQIERGESSRRSKTREDMRSIAKLLDIEVEDDYNAEDIRKKVINYIIKEKLK
ncbi:helix-turn-helix domain-containing protein, partial [Clostridioides difficile]